MLFNQPFKILRKEDVIKAKEFRHSIINRMESWSGVE